MLPFLCGKNAAEEQTLCREVQEAVESGRVTAELREKLGCDAVIHMDPVVTDDGVTEETRRRVQTLIHCIDDAIDIHDFRMVEGPTHTNLIFDLVIPHNCKMKKSDIYQRVNGMVNELGPQYYTVITVENSFVAETGLES